MNVCVHLSCQFALSALVRPIVVNVGRAGAANLDVIQEVEYVKREAKIVYLLECKSNTHTHARTCRHTHDGTAERVTIVWRRCADSWLVFLLSVCIQAFKRLLLPR